MMQREFLEIRLVQPAPGMGWEWLVRHRGVVLCASDGDALHHTPEDALKEARAAISMKEVAA